MLARLFGPVLLFGTLEQLSLLELSYSVTTLEVDESDFFGSNEGTDGETPEKPEAKDWWQVESGLTPNKLDTLIDVVNKINDVFGNYRSKLK